MFEPRPNTGRAKLVWLPLILLLAALLLRVLRQHDILESWPNLFPVMALAFTGAVLFPRTLPWWSWAALLPLVDALSMGPGWLKQGHGVADTVLSYVGVSLCFALAAWWGSRLRGRAGVVDTLLGTLACSIMFYLVTNSLAWGASPDYAKTFTGWVQALTVGTPGFPPTWLFFRNSLIADLSGATVLLIAYNAEALMRKLRAMPWLGWGKAEPLAA